MQVKQLEVGGFDHNFSYLVTSENEAAIVDPCGQFSVIEDALKLSKCTLRYIFVTHSHRDHIEHVNRLKQLYPNVQIASQENCFNHQMLPLGPDYFEVIYTPGHTKDSIVFRSSTQDALFTGDTLFINCCGFCEPNAMWNSLRFIIFELPDSLEVYSGHDYGEVKHRSLGEEKQFNPYLNTSDFELFKERLKSL